MYLRVKRQKTTIFVEVEPSETVIEVKAKLQKLLDGKRPEDMKLVLVNTASELEDAHKLVDLKVSNNDIIGLCYRKEDGAEGDNAFEDVNIDTYPDTAQ